jgi:Serpin (serine protease inhibitor)
MMIQKNTFVHPKNLFVAEMQLQFKMYSEATQVVVDRPFVLFIKDDAAETVVFAAKVENPLGVTAATEAPVARALVDPAAPTTTTKVTLYPPNFFPGSLNETKVLLQKLNASTATLNQAADAPRHSSVVMRIPPKEARKINKDN